MPGLVIPISLRESLSVGWVEGTAEAGLLAHESWLLNIQESCEPAVNYSHYCETHSGISTLESVNSPNQGLFFFYKM